MSDPSHSEEYVAGTPRIWVAKGYDPRPVKIGTYRGRMWHYQANELGKDSLKRLFAQTLCGRRADERWRPSWQNDGSKICGKCVRFLAAFEATHSEVPRG